MAQTGTRTVRNAAQASNDAKDQSDSEDQNDVVDDLDTSDEKILDPSGGAFGNDGDLQDDLDLSAAVDRANEAQDVDRRAKVEDRRDEAMREFSILPPDDYKNRQRAQTHIAAQNLNLDVTVPGGRIINRRGHVVNAEGERIDDGGGRKRRG